MTTKNRDEFLIANNFMLLAISLHFLIIHPNNAPWKELNDILESIQLLFISLGIRYGYLALKAYFPKTNKKTIVRKQSPAYFITSKPVKSWKSTAP